MTTHLSVCIKNYKMGLEYFIVLTKSNAVSYFWTSTVNAYTEQSDLIIEVFSHINNYII